MLNKITVIVSCFVALLAVGGCTLSANPSTTTYYYNPNWTPDGKILCTKNVQTVSGGSGGSGGTDIAAEYYLSLMNDDGTGETNIKKIGAGGKVAASPLGNYYAYTEGNYVKVVDTSGNDVSAINAGATTDSLDWSPDESKLVYGIKTASTSEIYTVNRDGSGKTFLTVGEDVAWRVGDYIAFEYSTPEGKTLSLIKSDGSTLTRLRIGFNAQIFNSGQVLYSYGLLVKQININGTNDVELFNDFYRSSPKLSFDNKKIASTDASKSYGIYIINITGTGEAQIK